MTFLSATCQALLALVFAIACVSKVRTSAAYAAFSTAVEALARVPRHRAGRVAGGVVALEAATALLLVLPGAGSAGLPVAAVLLAGFTYVVARALRDGTAVACRCFGDAGDRPAGPAQLVRNALLLGAVAAAVPGSPDAGSLPWPGWFAAWLTGAVCAVLVVTGDEVVALVRPVRSPGSGHVAS
ncbi:MauE/DoxX family redox-associated membrane protein [Streptomyces sp. NPDC007907]|uniref:MauE/DoxX family redox-associated membrane protein n=1 Tax=Streptomyces sp. NPDC007907 TaxID=3364789 RepID=UPI0036E048DA